MKSSKPGGFIIQRVPKQCDILALYFEAMKSIGSSGVNNKMFERRRNLFEKTKFLQQIQPL